MNYDNVFNTIQKQWEEMRSWMALTKMQLSVIYENNNRLTADYHKMVKRIARIEDKLKLTEFKEEPIEEEEPKEGE